MTATRRAFVLGALALCAPRAFAAGTTWDRLRRGGLVILMRHGGPDEARRVGARIRQEHVPIERAYTSPCGGCEETARLAFGSAEEWEPLGASSDAARLDEDADHVRKRILGYSINRIRGNVAMVTHAANIAALTKRSVGTAELVIVRPDGCCGLRVVDQLKLA